MQKKKQPQPTKTQNDQKPEIKNPIGIKTKRFRYQKKEKETDKYHQIDITLHGLFFITIYPFFLIAPACCGYVLEAPASALDSK